MRWLKARSKEFLNLKKIVPFVLFSSFLLCLCELIRLGVALEEYQWTLLLIPV